jgi:lipopolysaccharide export system protein LptA
MNVIVNRTSKSHDSSSARYSSGQKKGFSSVALFWLRFALIAAFIIQGSLLFSDTITFSGNTLKTILAKGKERTVLTGNVVLTSEDNLIHADSVELYGDDFAFVRCNGNVHVVNKKKEVDVTSEQMYYDRKQKMIRFQGNVVMEDKKNETIVKGGYLENWEDEELVIIQLGVRILKKDMACRAEFARYFRKDDRLELSGLPRVIRKGDLYTALKIYVNLKNDEVTLEGSVTGEVKWEDEKKKDTSADEKKSGETPNPDNTPAIEEPKPTDAPKDSIDGRNKPKDTSQ